MNSSVATVRVSDCVAAIRYKDIETFVLELEHLLKSYSSKAERPAQWGYRISVEGNSGLMAARGDKLQTSPPDMQEPRQDQEVPVRDRR